MWNQLFYEKQNENLQFTRNPHIKFYQVLHQFRTHKFFDFVTKIKQEETRIKRVFSIRMTSISYTNRLENLNDKAHARQSSSLSAIFVWFRDIFAFVKIIWVNFINFSERRGLGCLLNGIVSDECCKRRIGMEIKYWIRLVSSEIWKIL